MQKSSRPGLPLMNEIDNVVHNRPAVRKVPLHLWIQGDRGVVVNGGSRDTPVEIHDLVVIGVLGFARLRLNV